MYYIKLLSNVNIIVSGVKLINHSILRFFFSLYKRNTYKGNKGNGKQKGTWICLFYYEYIDFFSSLDNLYCRAMNSEEKFSIGRDYKTHLFYKNFGQSIL